MAKVRIREMNGENGGTLLEMALVLPAFFMLLFGLVNFAETMFEYTNATYACRTAAHYASLHSTTSSVPCNATCVQNIVTPILYIPAYATATVTTTYGSSNTVGSTVKVATTIDSYISIPFLPLRTVAVGSSVQRTISR
jgi:Flp pilus assembly protein TadG